MSYFEKKASVSQLTSLIQNKAFAHRGAKCGVPAPKCIISQAGQLDRSSTVQLSSALICEPGFKLYITGDFRSCCQPKGIVLNPPTTEAVNPRHELYRRFTSRIHDCRKNFEDLMVKPDRSDEDIIQAVAKASKAIASFVIEKRQLVLGGQLW